MTVHLSGPTATQLHQRTLEEPCDHRYVLTHGYALCVLCGASLPKGIA